MTRTQRNRPNRHRVSRNVFSLSGAGALVFATVMLTGCQTIPQRNAPLERYEADAGYRYQNIAPGEQNSDSLLVILTFSGGGTRAAAFSYGVLEKLRETEIVWEGQTRCLLDEVDIISSVSGGSLTAAYFGLFGDRIFEDFRDKVLYRNLQDSFLKEALVPFNWPKLASPFYGRTDMLAEDFSQRIFEDMTFADLMARNQRPFLIINATDMALGNRFEFTQRQFDLLYSDLAPYPVGHAVAASAAFPGLLTPVVFRSYPKQADYVPPPWVEYALDQEDMGTLRHRQALNAQSYIQTGSPFIHLCDGGVTDNLGLLPVIQFLNDAYPDDTVRDAIEDGVIKKVLVITVNAKRANEVSWGLDKKILGLLKVLGVVSSTQLSNFTDAQLALMHLSLEQRDERRRVFERITDVMGEDAAAAHFPDLVAPPIDYHFVEVDFDRVHDDEERRDLNKIPTAFKLKREQVDLLRCSAARILDSHPEFLRALAGLRE